MRIVAILSVAFVVLVGVVAVTYPNESDEVRQRNAAYMKLDGIKGESVKAGVEQGAIGLFEDWFGGNMLAKLIEASVGPIRRRAQEHLRIRLRKIKLLRS